MQNVAALCWGYIFFLNTPEFEGKGEHRYKGLLVWGMLEQATTLWALKLATSQAIFHKRYK